MGRNRSPPLADRNVSPQIEISDAEHLESHLRDPSGSPRGGMRTHGAFGGVELHMAFDEAAYRPVGQMSGQFSRGKLRDENLGRGVADGIHFDGLLF